MIVREKFKYTIVAVFVLLCPMVSALAYNHVQLGINDLPYLATTGDSISFQIPGDTVWLNTSTTSMTLDNRTYYYGIVGINNKSDVFVDFGDKAFIIDTGGDETSYRQTGIAILGHASMGLSNITIANGAIIRRIGGGEEAGSSNTCISMLQVRDVSILNMNLTIDGYDGLCIWIKRFWDSMRIIGGRYTNNASSYRDRQYYDCSVIMAAGDTWQDTAYGEIEIRGINATLTPHGGIYAGHPNHLIIPKIIACTLNVDAQNVLYDTLDCFPGDCGTGRSSTNSYAIVFDRVGPGTLVDSCVITSGSNYSGGRGILIQNSVGTAEDPIIIRNNYMECNNGPDGESTDGAVRVLRLRSLDGRHWDYVNIINNTFVGIVDNNPATTAVGKSSSVLQFGAYATDVGYANAIIEGNKVISRALTTGTDSRAAEFCTDETYTSTPPITIRNNSYISSGSCVRTADIYNAGSARYLTFEGDTLSYLPPSDSGVLDDTATWYIGYYLFDSPGIIARDCFYRNGASDTSITLYRTANHELTLERTIRISALGNNDLLVDGASVTVVNNYGQTVLSGVTSNGVLSGVVSYRYESSSGDSTNFNPFHVSVLIGGDSNDSTFVVSWDRQNYTIHLAGTNGTINPGVDPLSSVYDFNPSLLRMDFSDDNDSIQVLYNSGDDALPDSIIFCYNTGGYPDSAISNRMAVEYGTYTNYTNRFTVNVNDPDTLFFSYWTKKVIGGEQWSSRGQAMLLVVDQIPPANIDSLRIQSLPE